MGVYFDDARGVVHEGYHDFFATMSGYASGDVVIGNAAELLLLQVKTSALNHARARGCMREGVNAFDIFVPTSVPPFFEENSALPNRFTASRMASH